MPLHGSLLSSGEAGDPALQGPHQASGLDSNLPPHAQRHPSPTPQFSASVKQKGLCQRKLFATEHSGSALLFFLFLDFVAVRVGIFFHSKFPLHQLFTLSPPICRLFGIGEPNRALWGPSQLIGVRSAWVSVRARQPHRSGCLTRGRNAPTPGRATFHLLSPFRKPFSGET